MADSTPVVPESSTEAGPYRPLAGLAPWWVLLETRGRRSGKPRTTPLARGPSDGDAVWLASVHGRRASWVRNTYITPDSMWLEAKANAELTDVQVRYATQAARFDGVQKLQRPVRLADQGGDGLPADRGGETSPRL